MPKKSRKSLSKRVKLKDKFKIARKVKEHHKKARKEAKKLDKKKTNVLKDPGVPTNYPYREQVMKELQFEHQRILAQRAEKKEAAKRRRAEVRGSLLPRPISTASCTTRSISHRTFICRTRKEEVMTTMTRWRTRILFSKWLRCEKQRTLAKRSTSSTRMKKAANKVNRAQVCDCHVQSVC